MLRGPCRESRIIRTSAARFARCFRSQRLGDLALLIASLPFTLPVIIALGFLMKLTSRGPIFFGHLRIGWYGRQFKV
jgi:lipopolysaccharide/colanic/teichoic acid biosynthesis glycosyltransferase